MSKSIRSFSFLIKPKALFYELIEELHENPNMSPEEMTCHIIKMFGGCMIQVPSVNELRLYQWILNNNEPFIAAVKASTSIKVQYASFIKIIHNTYHGELSDVDITQIASSYLEVLTGRDYHQYKNKSCIASSARYAKKQTIYKHEQAEADDGVPPTENEDDEEW